MAVGEVDEYTRIPKILVRFNQPYRVHPMLRHAWWRYQCCSVYSAKAAEAWSQDIERSKALFEAVMRENEGVLIEDLPKRCSRSPQSRNR